MLHDSSMAVMFMGSGIYRNGTIDDVSEKSMAKIRQRVHVHSIDACSLGLTWAHLAKVLVGRLA